MCVCVRARARASACVWVGVGGVKVLACLHGVDDWVGGESI